MKALVLVLVLGGALRADTLPLMTAQLEALTPIDALPTPSAINAAFTTPSAQLQAIALAADAAVDFGVQLRAIRALPDYCPAGMPCGTSDAATDTLVHATLTQIIDGFAAIPVPDSHAILRLRAAIESLGIAGVSSALPEDVDRLVSFLNNPSRDVRATTATALGTLCVSQASMPLLIRLSAETSQQVRLAISAALRRLAVGGGCS